jgi:hypothetical protein
MLCGFSSRQGTEKVKDWGFMRKFQKIQLSPRFGPLHTRRLSEILERIQTRPKWLALYGLRFFLLKFRKCIFPLNMVESKN